MGSHFGLPSLPHLTSSAKQSIRLALRSVLAFVVSALLCYLPGTIPGTSPVKALENSYISLSAMIVSSSSLGETTRRGLMSSIGCAVAYGIALALLELVAAVVGTDKELNTERRLLIVSSGLIATFILTFALQLVTIEPDTQKISIMLIGQAVSRAGISLWGGGVPSSVQAYDFSGVAIGSAVAIISLAFPWPILASSELGLKLQAGMRQLCYAHLCYMKLILIQSQPLDEQTELSPSMTKLFAGQQLNWATNNLKGLSPLFNHMWWEPGTSGTIRKAIHNIVTQQQTSARWLQGLAKVHSSISDSGKGMGEWYKALTDPIADDLLAESAMMRKSSEVVSKFVLKPTRGCGPCFWMCCNDVSVELEEICSASKELNEIRNRVRHGGLEAHNKAAEKILSGDLTLLTNENVLRDSALFFSSRCVSCMLESLHECEQFSTGVLSHAGFCDVSCVSAAELWHLAKQRMVSHVSVSVAAFQFSFRVAFAMMLAFVVSVCVPNVGSKVSFHTAMLIAGGSVEKRGTIKVSLLRVLGAMMAINLLPIVLTYPTLETTWLVPLFVGSVWMFAMKYNELENPSIGYAYKMGSFAATSVLVNYDFYVAPQEGSNSYLTFLPVITEVAYAAAIVVFCELVIFPRSGQRLVLRALHATLALNSKMFSSLQESLESLEATKEDDSLAHLSSDVVDEAETGDIDASAFDEIPEALSKSTPRVPQKQQKPQLLHLATINVKMEGDNHHYLQAEKCLAALPASMTMLKQKITSLDGDPAFGMFVAPRTAFEEVHQALNSVWVWASIYAKLVRTGFDTKTGFGARNVQITTILSCEQLKMLVPVMASCAAMFRNVAAWDLVVKGKYEWSEGTANSVLEKYREQSRPVDEAYMSLSNACNDTEEQLLLILQSILSRKMRADADADVSQLGFLILSGLIIASKGVAQSAENVLLSLHSLHQTYTANELHAKVETLVLGRTGAAAFRSLSSLELPENLNEILDGRSSEAGEDDPEEQAAAMEREDELRDMAVVKAHSIESLSEGDGS